MNNGSPMIYISYVFHFQPEVATHKITLLREVPKPLFFCFAVNLPPAAECTALSLARGPTPKTITTNTENNQHTNFRSIIFDIVFTKINVK